MSKEVGDVANDDGDEGGQAGGQGKSKQLAVKLYADHNMTFFIRLVAAERVARYTVCCCVQGCTVDEGNWN